MKKLTFLYFYIFSSLFFHSAHLIGQKSITANDVLKKTSTKLNSLKEYEMKYTRILNYPSEDYASELKVNLYVKFNPSDTLIGFSFQADYADSKAIYNGNELFFLEKKEKTLEKINRPTSSNMVNLPFFTNSLVTLKSVIPKILSDKKIPKTLSDTIINNSQYHFVTFILENTTINGLGGFSPVSSKMKFIYKLIISKKDYLPIQVIQSNDKFLEDFVFTSFEEMNCIPKRPAELSWYHSTYVDFKNPESARLKLIKKDSDSPIFNLPYNDSKKVFISSDNKSKFTLLEFWIKNCGHCIEAVPVLNVLFNKYDSKTLQILGINASDSNIQIVGFNNRNNPKYQTLLDKDGAVTKEFGVDEYPTVVLMNQKGKVVYSGSLNLELIEEIISSPDSSH